MSMSPTVGMLVLRTDGRGTRHRDGTTGQDGGHLERDTRHVPRNELAARRRPAHSAPARRVEGGQVAIAGHCRHLLLPVGFRFCLLIGTSRAIESIIDAFLNILFDYHTFRELF